MAFERQMLITSLRNTGGSAQPRVPRGKQVCSWYFIIPSKASRWLSNYLMENSRCDFPYGKTRGIRHGRPQFLLGPPPPFRNYKNAKFLCSKGVSGSAQLFICCLCSRCSLQSNLHTSNRDGKLPFPVALCRISSSVLRRMISRARRSWSLTLLALKIDPYP